MAAVPAAFAQFCRRYPAIQVLTVQWGDMDAYRHVNNVCYFRYFESARLAYFRLMVGAIPATADFDKSAFLGATGVGPILASTTCNYKLPLTYPDVVFAASSVVGTSMGSDRFVMEHALFSAQSGRVAATGQGTIVTYDYARQCKAAIPPAMVDAIRAVEIMTASRTDTDISKLFSAQQALLA